jgi:hypothetical protein
MSSGSTMPRDGASDPCSRYVLASESWMPSSPPVNCSISACYWRASSSIRAAVGSVPLSRSALTASINMAQSRSRGAYLNLVGIKGPSDLRLDQEDLVLSTQAGVLLVIKNRQAAETASDHYPQHAMLWTQGMMGLHSLDALQQLSSGNPRVTAIPDADLGSVRIAEQILRAVQAHRSSISVRSLTSPARCSRAARFTKEG